MKQNNLLDFLSKTCHYAQEHINDTAAWPKDPEDRRVYLEVTSYQVACFLAQNTLLGDNGVDFDVVLDELVKLPMKSEKRWNKIISKIIKSLGGLKSSQFSCKS